MKNVLAIGHKGESGEIVVTDVLCANFPEMTQPELAELSWRLEALFREFRLKRLPERVKP